MTQSDYIRPTLTVADYVGIVRRRAWVIAETTVLLAAVAFLFSVQQAKLYQSSAQMLISRQDLGAALTGLPNPDASVDPVRLAQTQAQLARVPEVARRTVIAARIPGLTPSQFLASSDVSASSSADLLTFTVENGAAGAHRNSPPRTPTSSPTISSSSARGRSSRLSVTSRRVLRNWQQPVAKVRRSTRT